MADIIVDEDFENKVEAILEADVAALIRASRYLVPYLDFMMEPESPGYHSTLPSAVAAFKDALAKVK